MQLRDARQRNSITITLPDLSARICGSLVALLERAVGIYAELIDVNGMGQPGVDKFVAEDLANLQHQVFTYMRASGRPQSVREIADGIGRPLDVERVFKLLDGLHVCLTVASAAKPAITVSMFNTA